MRKIIFILFLFPLFVIGQDRTIDSLKLALKNAKHDTTRCNILNAMIEAEADDNIWPQYNDQLKQLAEKNIAGHAMPKKNYLKYLANALNNIGYLAQQKGDIKKALVYWDRSLKIQEEIGDKRGIASSLHNIAFIYKEQGDLSNALEYNYKSIKNSEEIGDKKGIATTLNNIGEIYNTKRDLPKALEYYHKSLSLQKEIDDKKGMADSYGNIGTIYYKKGALDTAMEYVKKGLKINEEIGHRAGISNCLENIASLYVKKGQLKEGLLFANKGMQVAKELGYPEHIKRSAGTLKKIFQRQNKYKEAFEMYELEVKMRDSINNEETQKAAVKKQMQYQYETQARELKNEQEKKDIIAKAELQQREKERNYFIIGFALVIILAGFIFRGYRQKQKANILITHQKKEVEESRKEILDSIHYAKRIQKAHLPSENYIDKTLDRLSNKNSAKS